MEELYLQAKENKSMRSEFLEQLFYQDNLFFIENHASALIYDPAGAQYTKRVNEFWTKKAITSEEWDQCTLTDTSYCFVVLGAASLLGKKEQTQPIFVTDHAFNYSYEEFLNVAKDHEGKHTCDSNEGIKISDFVFLNHKNAFNLRTITLDTIMEARACHNQANHAAKYGLPNSSIWIKYEKHMDKLTDIFAYPKNEFERRVVGEFLRCREI